MGAWAAGWLLSTLWASTAHAGAPSGDAPTEIHAPNDPTSGKRLDWHDAWAHTVRLQVSLGRATGRDLGAGGLALQWEWWPESTFSFAARTFGQSIRVRSRIPDEQDAFREATGGLMQVQGATPGKVKLFGGLGTGVAFVNGRLPPSDRWSRYATHVAGVVEAHGGVLVMVAPVSVEVSAAVYLFSEGPPVPAVTIGVGPMLVPGRGIQER